MSYSMKYEYALTETMADVWPMKITKRADGFYIELKNETVGPFESKQEVHWDMSALQDRITGWIEPVNYVGIVFQQGRDKWYVDRWDTEDGPFTSQSLAQAHRDKLKAEFRAKEEAGVDA
jgi:hypothetical protein